jgi:hypothetical protein
MEFPITRERLQNYRENEAVAVETKQRVSKEMKQICKDVEILLINSNERKYVYRISGDIKYGFIFPMNNPIVRVNQKGILKELIEALENTFIDCKIILDPLETYILIDWS